MSNVITLASDTAAFLSSVSAQAQKTGKAQSDMVALLVSGAIDWSDDGQVSYVARAYRTGRMAASLGLSLAKAGVIEAAGQKARDDAQTKAYNAAKVSWYETARSAGMPKKGGGTRAAKPDAATKAALAAEQEKATVAAAIEEAMTAGDIKLPAKVAAKVDLATELTSRAETFEDVQAFAEKLAKLAQDFDKRAPKGVDRGPYRSILWDFIKAVNKAAAAPEKSEPAHPVKGASVAQVSAAVHAPTI